MKPLMATPALDDLFAVVRREGSGRHESRQQLGRHFGRGIVHCLLGARHQAYGNRIEELGDQGDEHRDLSRHFNRRVFVLFQAGADALAVGNALTRPLIEPRAKFRERLQLLELGISKLEVARYGAVGRAMCALPPTRETDLPTSTAGSTPSSKSDGDR